MEANRSNIEGAMTEVREGTCAATRVGTWGGGLCPIRRKFVGKLHAKKVRFCGYFVTILFFFVLHKLN